VRLAVTSVLALALLAGAPDSARAERPENRDLVLAGSAMAIPAYLGGVALHEGMHALVAKMYGRTITSMSIFPGRHPRNHRFYFGYVSYRPRLPVGKRTFLLVAPKLMNLIWLGAYAGLVTTDTLPANRYGQLAMAVWASGQWTDFSKDIALFWRRHDINVALEINGATSFWKRLPYKLLHLGLSLATGYVVIEGYRGVFEDEAGGTLPYLPLVRGGF
jgi:hypothetical protein